MKKIYAAVTIIAISVAPTILAGCAAMSDDIVRIATKQGSNVGDDVARQIPKKRTAVVPVISKSANQNELLKKCSRQAGKTAVVEAWQRRTYSGSKVQENYLLGVARDAIQRCTVGSVGDNILDKLADSAVSDFRQEYPQAQLD
jgi:hypothetical protein